MKNIFFLIISFSLLTACSKSTLYVGTYGQVNETQVVLANDNFNVLGSFTGVASEKKLSASVKGKEGLIAQAKANLLQQAANKGITLTGSRTLINVTVDLVENQNRVTACVSAEIIEFTR